MLKQVMALAVLVGMSAALATAAWARCPPGTMYSCSQGFNGKVICGCK